MATEYVEYNGQYTGEQIDSAIAKVGNLKTVATSGSYNDLTNKPTIPDAANDATLTIKKNGTAVGTFTADADTDVDINITVPTTASDVGALPDSTKYAGASTAGGAATSASKLTVNAGSSTNPVYFTSGLPTPCTYNLEKSVPANAVFTDTTYESKSAASGGTAVSLVTTGEKYTWNTVTDKVDKVTGKGLSTNDYTNEDKTVVTASVNSVKNLAIPYAYNVYNGGITITRDDKYRVTANGTAGATIRYIVTQLNLVAGSYIVSGCTDGSGSTYRLRIGTGTENTFLAAVTTEEKTITLNTDTLVTIEVNVFNSTTVTNKVFPVMVRKADITDNTYVPPSYSQQELTRKMLLTSPDAPLNILCVGDSISYGVRNGLRGFIGGLGFPYQIDGITGATLSTAQSGVKNIPQQLIDSTYQNPDVIIANGGVNDYLKNAPLGTIPTAPITTDAADTALDKSTICGGAQHLFYNMIKLYPDAQRFFLCTHKTTAEAKTYTYGNNLASVSTQTRQTNGVDFVNNDDGSFAIFRTASTDAPAKAAFTVYEVQLSAGTYLLDALDGGKWVTGSNEVLMMRYTDKSNNSVLADVTDKPKLLTLAASKTVVCSMWAGKKYNGVYKIITPVMKACTETEAVQDWTVSQNRALLTQTDIFDAIKAIAKLYGVKIIDVFGESMMNTAFSQYVSPTHWDSDHSVTDREYCDDDGIHPLNKGYNQAYLPLIRKALQLGTGK